MKKILKPPRKKKVFKLNKQTKKSDFLLVMLVMILSLFGLLMIFEASSVSGLQDFNDKYHFVKNQSVRLIAGIIAMFLAAKIDYKRYYGISVILLVGVLISLIGVFLPGIGIKVSGAHRWINLGLFRFQPTDLVKLVLVIYLSSWFTYKEKGRFLPFTILLGLILGLIILEPDLGTAIIIGSIAVVLYFISGAPLWQFLLLIPAGFFSVLILSITSAYRYRRLMTFLNTSFDPLGASYHVRQLLIALGSGGLLGKGIGKSRQKYYYLPEASTDSIFAIIGEELGFVGVSIVILLFSALIFKGFSIALKAPSRFGQLLAAGITSWLGIQTIINLGAVVALLPLTGAPLVFISYGGSSLIVAFIGIGILLNISRQSQS